MVKEGNEVNVVEEVLTLDQLHWWLGYISASVARKLVSDGLVTGLRLEDGDVGEFFCESCAYDKMTWTLVAKIQEGKGAKVFGEEIHSDVWEPSRIKTKGSQRFYVSFIDNYSQWAQVEFLAKKSEVFKAYKTFEVMCKIQFNTWVKTLHSDQGGEYIATNF